MKYENWTTWDNDENFRPLSLSAVYRVRLTDGSEGLASLCADDKWRFIRTGDEAGVVAFRDMTADEIKDSNRIR